MSDKIQNFYNSLSTLHMVPKQDYRLNKIILSGCVNTFSLTFELAWKAMEWILNEEGIDGIKTSTPKMILESAFTRGLINDEKAWIHLLRMRNDEAHHYNEDEAIKLCDEVSEFLYLFDELKEKIKEEGY